MSYDNANEPLDPPVADAPDAPPWSLLRLAPGFVAALDADPDDFVARLVAADLVEESGFGDVAERMRWAARAGRAPTDYGDDGFGYYMLQRWEENGGPIDAHDLPHTRFAGFVTVFGGWRFEPTRQAAEDALYSYLLGFDADPFAAA